MSEMKVGIQGVKAAFHDVAARKYFQGRALTLVECPSFKLLSEKLKTGEADACIMAIENSIAGSILPNYSLLETYGFKISGEVYLRIEMSLLALPGQRLEDIRVVQSHPMALLQCEEFLAAHPTLQAIEKSDTAESAKEIAQKKLAGHAAIASKLAAETYGLEVLREGIESNHRNYTRFLVICRGAEHVAHPRADKASIRFEVADRPGALANVLGVFNRHGVNMTKIQSVPILGKPYQYSFHVDLEWQSAESCRKALKEIAPETVGMIHFGEYPRGEKNFS